MNKLLIILFLFFSFLYSQDLAIGPEDVRIVPSAKGGYDLFVRKKPGIMSIVLTESTADPDKKVDVYAYRNPNFDEENGNEKRMLNGSFLPSESKLYSLIDSTPEANKDFPASFRIFLPYIIIYGYSWSRSGEVAVEDGLFINIRTFEKPYGDYSGKWQDNPFQLKMSQASIEGPTAERYIKDTIDAYTKISASEPVYSEGPTDLADKIAEILSRMDLSNIQIVLALDTTNSMEDDFPALKKNLVKVLQTKLKDSKSFQIGFTLYRDYLESYVTKNVPFTSDWSQFQKTLDSLVAHGGRDTPEAVWEALSSAINGFEWTAPARLVILIGDAPPHPVAKGTATEETVMSDGKKKGVQIQSIILPQ